MKIRSLLLFLFVFLFTACTPKPEDLIPLVEQTLKAVPTQTAYPTYTAMPTYTPVNTQTPDIRITERIVIASKTPTPTNTETPLYTPTITETPTTTPTMTATPDPLKADKYDGFYLVGVDIATGVWRSNGTGDRCWWAITTKEGKTIKNHYGMAGGTMYVSSAGYQVELEDCGYWTWLEP